MSLDPCLFATGALRRCVVLAATAALGVSADALGAVRGAQAERVARDHLRDHLSTLGVTAGDLDGLRVDDRETTTGGITIMRLRQYVDGIPALDHGLKVALARDGRVLTVLGALQPGLTAPASPRISAAEAL